MTDNKTIPQSLWPRHISWLTIVLALLAIISFIAISSPGVRYGVVPMGIGVNPSAPMMDSGASGVSTQGRADSNYYYPYPNPDVPVTDTREFLKVYYNASMRTRDVQNLTRRVVTTVRGNGGRIDQESSSPQYGYVNFAIPQSKYEAFRNELESLVSNRFISVNISSQNFLSQKVSIEEQQKRAETTLSDYKTTRQKIVNAHASNAKAIQSKIDADLKQLEALRAEIETPQILAQIQAVSDDLSVEKQRLANENSSYAAQSKNADQNIKYAEDWLKAVDTQDQTLLDNVATVNGTVSIRLISFWEIALLYLPGYWIPAIFAALAFLSFLRDRRRFGTA